ncbi:hypothetical protein AQUCO_00400497v1 [Aquilegia coerulea]|uniref:F-box domain-containing protein n=1 Tax=Aquilegia coerulea TaxID=218851 RepID=A0A2G5EV75_AQUCA|nr:hypothetical protein AQUCO_00400497v1 [Aquilegia coerulea]
MNMMMKIALPEEILMDILSRLPVKSLMRCKCSCKDLIRVITSPYFVKLHLKVSLNNPRILFTATSNEHFTFKTTLDYEVCSAVSNYNFSLIGKFKLVGSCNGLVCLSDYKTVVVLCNPVTKESIEVPFDLVEPLPAADYIRQFDLGFGHDPLTNTYKVIRIDITFSASDLGDCKVYLYTLGSNNYKEWKKLPTPGRLSKANYEENVPFVNGALHWYKLLDKCRFDDKAQSLDNYIIAFDVGSEKFQEIPAVSSELVKDRFYCLGVLQGQLSENAFNSSKELVDVWLMKDYGVKESWSRLRTIIPPSSCSFEPLVLKKDGGILLKLHSKDKDHKGCLYACDTISDRINEYVHGVVDWTNVYVFVESLVSIASTSGGGQQPLQDLMEEGNNTSLNKAV